MAAIGKIRSWGPVLVGIIALALFGFIAGDMWRSCETTGNQQRQQVGEVLGQKMSYTDYEGMIQEYENVLKTMGYELNTDEQRNELRDYVWQNFVQNTSSLMKARVQNQFLQMLQFTTKHTKSTTRYSIL